MTKFDPEVEKRIANAIVFSQENPGLKLSKVAVQFVVPYNLFYRRLHGRAAGNTHGGHNKALDATQDNALKAYINFLIYINSEPNLSTIRQAGNSILRACGSTRILGRDWAKNWFSRNKHWLKTIRTKSLSAERKAAHLSAVIELHFMDFEGVLIKYGITQNDTFNMDETGFRIGCLGGQLVITHLATKAVYLSDPDNREMASSVECISGAGWAVKSMIILAGTVLMEKHFDNAIDDDVLFAISESGYSNAYLGLEWLKHFDRQTAGRREGKY
jgi:hypothetical protein